MHARPPPPTQPNPSSASPSLTTFHHDHDAHRKQEPFGAAVRLISTQVGAATRFHRLFNSDQANVYGVYSLQLYNAQQRKWETVLIDDRMPCRALPKEDDAPEGALPPPPELLPWHARCARANELWAALLHKAAAKYVGSYHKLAAMAVQDIVVMLAGGGVAGCLVALRLSARQECGPRWH